MRKDLLAFKQRLGYVPEEPHPYAHLSGFEFLAMVRLADMVPVSAVQSNTP